MKLKRELVVIVDHLLLPRDVSRTVPCEVGVVVVFRLVLDVVVPNEIDGGSQDCCGAADSCSAVRANLAQLTVQTLAANEMAAIHQDGEAVPAAQADVASNSDDVIDVEHPRQVSELLSNLAWIRCGRSFGLVFGDVVPICRRPVIAGRFLILIVIVDDVSFLVLLLRVACQFNQKLTVSNNLNVGEEFDLLLI